MHHRPSLSLSALWLLLPALAAALPEDREQPIQLEADTAQLDQTTGVSVYQGNVTISQGSMKLSADTVTISVRDGEFRHLQAEGGPATFRYLPARDKPEVVGYGRRMDYDVATGTVVITRNARITQAKDEFTGERIEYDLDKDLVKARGGDGGRVQVILQPRAGKPGGKQTN